MRRTAFSLRWRPTSSSTAGFSLIELLASLFIASIMLTAMAGFFSMSVATRHNMGEQAEAAQGLRALLSTITQELRQAGACLTQVGGQFIALEGEDNDLQDSLTLRIGRVDRNTGLCVIDALTAVANVGDTSVTVGDATKFHMDDRVYITPTSVSGEFYTVAEAAGTTLTLTSPLVDLNAKYDVGTGVFALEERTYAIDTSTYDRPVLTVALNGGTPQPLVDGVEEFNVRYLLAPCDPDCAATIDLPADTAQWWLVAEVAIKATVRSRHVNREGEFVYARTGEEGTESEYIIVKPRNFLRA